MKAFLSTILVTMTLAVNANYLTDAISNAFKTGNATKIATHFEGSVNLSIPDNNGVFSKTQAELILKTFFSGNKPSNFSKAKNGVSSNGSEYSIGDLTTGKGNYTVYVLFKKMGAKLIIQEIKIDKKNKSL